ncbi:Holliday junction branch migration protein RuvA [Planococcaceae bacterium Storch 2/2-2]|nr:Holliday junction branch migration protein RuvA [Planococcaceae bacterium Storch 2/2-2]
MYDYIQGVITKVTPEAITLECRDIGYRIQTPNPFKFEVSEQRVRVYTFLNVREDTHELLGFQTEEERALFKKLITVSGIGPKGALAIVANGDPMQVVQAIEHEDEKYLVQFPGVGKKTARQIILDLKGKLEELIDPLARLSGTFQEAPSESVSSKNEALDEALLALEVLGYSARELKRVEKVLVDEPNETTDHYMKRALQLLVKETN